MMKKICVVLLACLFLTGAGLGQAEETDSQNKNQDIQWYSFDKGMALGKNDKKKVFLNFYADWCQYCKIMESSTFKDKSVISYLNDNFIAVRVNSDQNRKIAADYKVTGLPVSWFIAENGENIGSQPGYIPAETLLPLLKYIYTDSYKKMDFMKFMETM